MKILDFIKQEKIYGIIREDDPQHACELAAAYREGGIKIIELNAPMEALNVVSKMKDTVIIQGGIITSAQATMALSLGADAISSPIFQQNLVRLSTCRKAFLIPSVTTPNEAYSAWKTRMPLIKIYPVAAMGGVKYIKELFKPMPFLNLLACGSIKLEKVPEYLKAGASSVGVGRELYLNDYQTIVQYARELIKSVEKI